MPTPATRFLTREHAGLIELAHRALDALACLVASVIVGVAAGFSGQDRQDWALLVLIQIFVSMLLFQQHDLYKSWRGRPYSDQFSRLMLAWLIVSVILWVIWQALDLDRILAAPTFFTWLAASLVVIVMQRAMLHFGIRTFRRRGLNSKRVLIYGAGSLGRSIANQIRRSPESGFEVAAFLDDKPEIKGLRMDGAEVLGGSADLEQILAGNAIDELWIALPLSATQRVSDVLEISNRHVVSVRLFPDLYGLTLLNHSVSELLGFPIIDLNVDRMQGFNRLIKELEDKVLGLVIFVAALPLIGMIALIIRLSSDGPILFKQRRRGWDGKPFTIYKFRTMQLHTEPPGQLTQARINDHRFTAIGRWLRKTSLDELPQLYNVLQGRMSLVGPRPHAIEHDNFYEKHIEGYLRRHRVKPGITGWAQINDLRGEVQELEEMSRRVKHDLYYIEHWSLWFDVRIILATVLKIFFSKKAW